MADSDQEKTEEPTGKRLSDARNKGQVASSKEINNFLIMIGATALVMFMLPPILRDLAATLSLFFSNPHGLDVSEGGILQLVFDLLFDVGLLLAMPFALFVLLAFLSSYFQHGIVFSAEQLKPDLAKLSPVRGLKRMFSSTSLLEFGKSIAKFIIVGGMALMLISPELNGLEGFVGAGPLAIAERLQDIVLLLLVAVTAMMAVLSVVDFAHAKMKHHKQLRMTKQEVKDEHKQSEGDPKVKGRIRMIRMERSRQRMMAAVPDADVVITNPTHYAVALAYDATSMAAPQVVAKGADLIAHRIRTIAEEADVPIVENPPLTRAIYATAEIGSEIPEQHYRAVAEIIGYIWRLKGKRQPARG